MLPLAVGMPILLLDHVDRSREKRLLKGKSGTITSWILHPNESSVPNENGERILTHIPRVVFVNFPDASWRLHPSLDKGEYPFYPETRSWYIDAGKKNPVLLVKRTQIQLSPGFATTAHVSQGQTLYAAMPDLAEGNGVGIAAAYVALTRVERRTDMLIFRPFPRAPYAGGAQKGPLMLLRSLQGEYIDWKTIEADLIPRQKCVDCEGLFEKTKFDASQWRNGKEAFCRQCVRVKCQAGMPWQSCLTFGPDAQSAKRFFSVTPLACLKLVFFKKPITVNTFLSWNEVCFYCLPIYVFSF